MAGIITGISQYKGKTLQIDFEEGEPLFLNSEVVADHHLKKGLRVPEEAVSQLIKANDTRRARERALYLLDVRDYSYIEMFKKLEASYPEDICFEVCNKLASLGLINDRAYAKKLAEHYSVTKKFGYYRAREEMKRRGISTEMAQEALLPYREEASDRIGEIIDRKYARYLTDEKGIDKVRSALIRLGYSYSEVNRAIKDYIENIEEE